MNKLDQILLDRECKYGTFSDVALRTNNIYAAMASGAPEYKNSQPHHREALHMIAQKVARLVTGRINDPDSWLDIAGYASLVHRQIMGEQESKAVHLKTTNTALTDNAAIMSMEEKIAAEILGKS